MGLFRSVGPERIFERVHSVPLPLAETFALFAEPRNLD
jgi:hypothetical protein